METGLSFLKIAMMILRLEDEGCKVRWRRLLNNYSEDECLPGYNKLHTPLMKISITAFAHQDVCLT